MAKKKKRRSVNIKEQAVMRLFRGEDMHAYVAKGFEPPGIVSTV